MSGSKRKHSSKNPPLPPEQAAAPRVVAIPKDAPPPIAANAAPAPKPKAERIGDILRQARVEREDDLYQIAEYLCIKPGFLIALENSRYDEFPADAYVIGFLRTYASFLGVDGKDAVDRYRYEMAGRRKKPVLSMPTPVSEGRAPSGIIMVAATVAVLLIYALWYGISSSNRTEVNAPPPLPTAAATVGTPDSVAGLTEPVGSASVSPTASSPATVPVMGSNTAIPPEAPGIMVTAAQSPGAAKATEEAAASAANAAPTALTKDNDKTAKKEDAGAKVYGDPNAVSHLLIRATQNSWIMVTDDGGKAIFDHVLKPGDVYKVPDKQGLTLTTGNGAGIVLTLDGTELPKVATGAPHIVRNISLDADHLTDTSTQ